MIFIKRNRFQYHKVSGALLESVSEIARQEQGAPLRADHSHEAQRSTLIQPYHKLTVAATGNLKLECFVLFTKAGMVKMSANSSTQNTKRNPRISEGRGGMCQGCMLEAWLQLRG